MIVLLLTGGSAFSAPRVYQKPSDFIRTSLGSIPRTQILKLTSAQQKHVRRILGKNYKTSSIRYWTTEKKTAYILEEIGKTEYITVGIIVKNRKVDSVKVLVYRESHGWEVARSSFTRQFRGAALRADGNLTRLPKNIAGATLSVRALTKLARLSLYLDSQR